MTNPSTSNGELTRLRVTGMDCPSCASTIDNALMRLNGVTKVEVNYTAETADVIHDKSAAPLSAIQDRIKLLGFDATVLPPRSKTPANRDQASEPSSEGRDLSHDHVDGRHDHAGHDHSGHDHAGHDHGEQGAKQPKSEAAHGDHEHGAEENPNASWWQQKKALVVGAVALFIVAGFVLSLATDRFGEWVYLPAAIVGLAFFGRRALVLAYTGSPFSIETLMSVAVIGAVAIGSVVEAAVVVLLFGIGELLEGVAAGRARAGIASLVALMPKTALVEEGGTTREVPASALAVNQVIVVRPGDRIAADGVVVEGTSDLDQSPVTGESTAVAKTVGDDVFAGSINASGRLRIKVTTSQGDNTIARIVEMVERAQSNKSPTARFIDRFSVWYTPAAMVAAALTILIPPLLFGGDWNTWVYRGLSLLLIACPCALVLSTPAAIASGLAAGARRGLLVKGGAALEAIASVKTVAFDKTGTLTEGRPRVTDMVPLGVTELELLTAAAAVESGSSHPLALAILRQAADEGIAASASTDAAALPGKGARAIVEGREVIVASPRHAAEVASLSAASRQQIDALEDQGKSVVVVLRDGQVLGFIATRDEARPDAAAGIAALRGLGLRTVMLTGDNRKTGAAVAQGLGLDVMSELLPEQKLAEITRLRAEGGVVMVGDGINDAPALAAADVGIAMGGGTEVALETADAALLKNRVTGIAEFVELARATLSNIHWNIGIALGLKAVFLVTSLLGITTLWMAILADTGATVIVTLNALRLLRFRPSAADRC